MISIGVLSADGTGKINQAGVDHYNRLINALIAKGRLIRIIWKKLRVFATFYEHILMQGLNHMWHCTIGTSLKLWKTNTMDGWTPRSCNWWPKLRIVFSILGNSLYWLELFRRKDFALYAETCFQQFGDRVKHWITFNEPHTFTVQGYDIGLQAPGRCSIPLFLFCRAGNSATEPYIVAHHVLLSHATVADIYHKKYKV